MPKILENEALALAQGIDSLPPEQQVQAADVLRRYREQQHNLGEPDWPSQEQAAQESEGRFRALFDDLKNVDNQSPSFTQGLRFSTDPDADRARVAGTAFLSRVYQKQPEEVSRLFPLLRDDYLNKRGQKTGLDDRAFYSFAQGEVKRMTAREKAALEGAKAALRGEDSGKALAAWQAANPDFGKEDSGFFSSGFNKAMEEDGDSLPVAANLLSLLESGSFKSKDGKAVSTPFTDEQAAQLGGMVEQLAGMKPRQRKSIYRAMNARIEAAGYDQKGFWAQMLSELDRGIYRASTTLGTQAGVLSDVMTAQANASQRSVDFSMDGGGGFSTPVLSVEEQQQLQRQRDFREQVGNVQAELQDIVAGRLDPVKPTVSWLNDTLETGMIKGPGAVAPFMAASAALGPWGAGILFTADFAEQNRRDLVGMGMDADQARQIGALAAPAQAAVESLSNLFQLGRFPAVSAALARFTKPVGGASLVGRYVQNSLLAGITEFTEEQIQDNFIVPASQELLAALNSDMPDVDWSFYKERAIQATPELAATLLPMALVFGGVMTAADAKLSAQMTGNIDALTALNFSQAQATEIVSQKTTEERIAKAASLWRSRAGNKASLEEGAKNLSAKLRELSSDTLKHQQELERRGILPRMLHAQDDSWLLTYNDGSTASFATHGEASKARWNWAEDQLGRMHALTREALTSMERNMSAGRELAVEFKPDARTAQDVVNEGAGMDQVLRRVEQGKALGDVPVEESFDNASAFDQATQDAEGFLSSLQILGSSRNEFKDGILRTTIKLWEGSNVLTLVEEKLEGDAKAILQSSTGRAWMLGVLRNYEQESGDKLFRDVADTGITNDDLAEAWSHLGQSYLVGRSSFGEPLQQNNMRRFSKLLMRAGLAGAINAESTFWQAVVNRAQKLGELKKAGKLGEDLAAELERQLGIDSQVVHEQGAIKEAQQVAQDVAQQASDWVDDSQFDNLPPSGDTFSMASASGAAQSNEPSPGGLKSVIAEIEAQGVSMFASENNGIIRLSKIVVNPSNRNQGIGTRSMQLLMNYADATNQRIALTPSSDFGGSKLRLQKFYRSLGFKPYKGFEVRETLMREPSSKSSRAAGGTFSASRAIPADASKVVQMPDGARLVGPTTFSIRAFHGTPHKVDKFRMDKLLTGEGNNAYGSGLYFAENREVAEGYAVSTVTAAPILWDGEPYNPQNPAHVAGMRLRVSKGDRAAAIAKLEPLNPDAAKILRDGNEAKPREKGNLYTVELLPDEGDFLDWDKPLAEQSEKVKARVAPYLTAIKGTIDGDRVYSVFLASSNTAQEASQKLASLGIPGIRYLDGGSRGAGDGTRNYVIFDENLIRILEENGKPVAQEPEQEPEPGELAPDSPVEDLPLEGDDIPWTEETFSIAPRVLPEVFPAFNEQIKNEIAAQTKTIAAMHIDRMKVGEFAGVPLQGGFFYPAIVDNLNKGVVWAFNADNIARGVANRAAANGGFIKLVLMQEGNVVGNKTFGTIWFKLLDEAIAAKRISKTAALTELNRVRAKFATHPDSKLRTDHVKTWKSIDEAREAIIGMPQKKRGATYFQKSKTVTKSQGVKIAYQSLLAQAMTGMGFPDAAAIVDSIEEPSFKGVPTGAVVGIIKIDPLSESQKVMTATEAGVPEHLSYKYVLHGKPVARMTKFKVIDETFPETKNKLLLQQHTNFPLEAAFAETFSLRVTPENPIANEINGVAAKDIFASAKQKFGITRSVYEAGYVLPDGAMLDFSGRSQTSDFKQGADLVFRPVGGRDWMKDQRGIDHREIEWGGMPDYSEQWGAMVDFLRLGAVRVDGNSGMISMHSRAKITAAQASALKAIVVAADGAYLDLEDDAGNRASMSLESGKWGKVQGLLNRWAAGETPEYTGTTFSLRPGDFASRVEAMFSPFQRSPEARLVMARVAKDRALRLGNELIDKANVIRTIGSIDREARVRAALAEDKAVQDYLDGLTPAARQTLEWEPSDLKDDPLVSAMLDYGKLMSKTTALQRDKVDLKMGDFDGAPWLPPSFYSKGSGIMPDQMAQAMHDAGLLPDAYTDTLWAELGKRIEASRKDKTAHREAVQAFKDAKKAASQKATQEAQAWANSTKKQAGSGKAQRDRIQAWLRVLDGILAAVPAKLRDRVGGYVKMAGIATDEAALRYLEDRVAKLNTELEKFLIKDGREQLERIFDKSRPKTEAGEKAKGKLTPEAHAWFNLAEQAAKLSPAVADERIEGIEKSLSEEMSAAVKQELSDWLGRPVTDDAEAQEWQEQRLTIFQTFGSVLYGTDSKAARNAAETTAAFELARKVYQDGRLANLEETAKRREKRAADRAYGISRVGSPYDPNKANARKKALNKASGLKGRIVDYLDTGLDPSGFFLDLLGHGDLYETTRRNILEAEMSKDDAMRKRKADFAAMLQKVFPGKSLVARLRGLWELQNIQEGTPVGSMSQLQAVQLTLWWMDLDSREWLESNGYGQVWQAQAESWLTSEARAVRSWLLKQYEEQYNYINPVFRRLRGVNLPRVDVYGGKRQVEHSKSDSSVSLEMDQMRGGMEAGFTKTRVARPSGPPKMTDALQNYWQNAFQVEHYVAFAETITELKAVFGHRDFRLAVETNRGQDKASQVSDIIKNLEQAGTRDAFAHTAQGKLFGRYGKAVSATALLFKLSVIAKQAPAMIQSMFKVGFKEYMISLGRILSGKGAIALGDMYRSDTVQRRLSDHDGEMAQAAKGWNQRHFENEIIDKAAIAPDLVMNAGWYAIGWTDARFTTVSAAVAYDVAFRNAKSLGMPDDEAKAYAKDEAELIVMETAQPQGVATKSLFENQAPSSLLRLLFAFQSANRQAFGLAWLAAKTSKKDTANALFTAALISAIAQTAGGLMRMLTTDDEPEDIFTPEAYLLGMSTATMTGIPLMGPVFEFVAALFGAEPRTAVNPAAATFKSLSDLFDGKADSKDISTIMNTVGLVLGGRGASIGVGWNVLNQLMGLYESATDQ